MAAKLDTTRTSRLTPVDGNFQQQYLAAEKAYGAGNYEAAQSICERLLGQLELQQKGPEQEAMLAWRAFVALLMGHVQLYGINDVQQAKHHYNLVLDSQPQETLKELAEQGLKNCEDKSQHAHGEEEEPPQNTAPKQPSGQKQLARKAKVPESLTDLIRDPFLSPNPPRIGVKQEAKPAIFDQQATEYEPLTLNNELSKGLEDLTLDPFLITASPPNRTKTDQSKTKTKLESALIEDKGILPHPTKILEHKKHTELENSDHPKQKTTTTSTLEAQTKLTPVTQEKQNMKGKTKHPLKAIAIATADDLLKNSLMRVVISTSSVNGKKENNLQE